MSELPIQLETIRQVGVARTGIATAGRLTGAVVLVRPLSQPFGFEMWEWYADLGAEVEEEWAALDFNLESVRTEIDGYRIRWFPLDETNRVVSEHFPELSFESGTDL